MLAEFLASDRKITAALLAVALVLGAALLARATPSKECPSPSCFSPRQPLTAREAYRMKREQGQRVLFVDVRGRGEADGANTPVGIDARVPYLEGREPHPEFRIDFTQNMDETLRAAHMRHYEPVILLARNGDYGAMAAQLLQEHGYSNVYVVNDGFDGL